MARQERRSPEADFRGGERDWRERTADVAGNGSVRFAVSGSKSGKNVRRERKKKKRHESELNARWPVGRSVKAQR